MPTTQAAVIYSSKLVASLQQDRIPRIDYNVLKGSSAGIRLLSGME